MSQPFLCIPSQNIGLCCFRISDWIKTFAVLASDVAANAAAVLLFAVYILVDDPKPRPAESDGGGWQSFVERVEDGLNAYIHLKTMISLGVALFVSVALASLGCNMAVAIGVLTFFCNFVPNVGPALATLLPAPIILLDPKMSGASKLLCFIVPVSIHAVVGNLIEPRIFGRAMDVHPVVVLLALAFWYALWGVPGAVLSVPLLSVCVVLVNSANGHPVFRHVSSLLRTLRLAPSPGSAFGSDMMYRTNRGLATAETVRQQQDQRFED
jgi:AI-2 transport protein TqsA